MTRLLPTDISDLGLNWSGFDSELLELTGLPLLDLAAGALGLSSGQAKALLAGKLTAVVPDTSGDGLIEGFSQALLRISEHLGTKAVIAAPDAQGLAQARSMGADFVLTSSDDEFLCRNLGTGATAENGQATGLGFAQALFHMSGNLLDGQTVLVIGAGSVGSAAAAHLSRLGATLVVSDLILEKATALADSIPRARPWSPALGEIPSGFNLILDASTSGQVFPSESIALGASISAPGMPFSFRPSPRYRLWSEPLATGTAVMLLAAALGPGLPGK